MLILRVFIQDVHKRIVGFKASTEENLVWEKEQNVFYITRKNKVISVGLCDICEPGSSVGIATGYGLDGPEIESRRGRDFPLLSRPALGPTQPPVQWVQGLSSGKERPGRDADSLPPSSTMINKE